MWIILNLDASRHITKASTSLYSRGLNILKKQDYGKNPPIGLKSLLNKYFFTFSVVMKYSLKAFCQASTWALPLVISKDLKEYP